MTTNDLVERVEAETANYNQMVINHSISPLENPAQIIQLRRTIAVLSLIHIFPEPVIGIAVEPKTQKDMDKLSNGLAKLAEEDLSLIHI